MNDRKWVINADQWCVVMGEKHETITKTENFFSLMVVIAYGTEEYHALA